ncbi:MAG: hypothetical protein KatS3mg108_1222 [Isosphaeraceae bacterium]|jgi:hypothetical protein|nr:MAG: hypothetical protein KatS3mg108_1222 [Isosphaeraceae bacterium]
MSLAFLIAYPLLQIYALWRCQQAWRTAAGLLLLVCGPFFGWALAKTVGWSTMTERNRAFLEILAPVPLLALLILLGAYEMTQVGKPSRRAG